MAVADLVVRGIGELVTCAGPAPRRGRALDDSGAVPRAAVAAAAGRVLAAGPEDEVLAAVEVASDATVLDAGGRLATPGFVDAHTHLVFAGHREDEFNRGLRGESYQEIASKGGGIRATVRATRAASDEELLAGARGRLRRMLAHGTTTAEAKTGYGLTLADELRALAVIRRLAAEGPLDLQPTLLAAHALPPEYDGRREQFLRLVREEIVPRAAPLARFCDVFCDASAFTPEESRAVLEAGRKAGLRPRIHADEFRSDGGAELAVDVGAASADHLGGVSDLGIERLAASETVAVLLPGTLYFLGQRSYAPARRLIDAGAIVALGTDLNPGTSYTESMPAILQLACLMMRMTVDEALVAATVNAACSLGLGDEVGSLTPGKRADLVLHDVPNRFHLVYHYGINHVHTVIRQGKVVHRAAGAGPVLY
jgi:imidazolonepropionase